MHTPRYRVYVVQECRLFWESMKRKKRKKSVKSSMTKLKIARKIIGMLFNKDDLWWTNVPKSISRSFVFFGTYFRSIFFSKVVFFFLTSIIYISRKYFPFLIYIARLLFYSRVNARVSQLEIIEATNFVALPRQATFI